MPESAASTAFRPWREREGGRTRQHKGKNKPGNREKTTRLFTPDISICADYLCVQHWWKVLDVLLIWSEVEAMRLLGPRSTQKLFNMSKWKSSICSKLSSRRSGRRVCVRIQSCNRLPMIWLNYEIKITTLSTLINSAEDKSLSWLNVWVSFFASFFQYELHRKMQNMYFILKSLQVEIL